MTNDSFLFGLERGRKEAARECAEMCLDHNTYVHADVDCQKWPEVIAEAIAERIIMGSEDKMLKIITSLVWILDAYKGGKPLISCQGQGMDGYSALANFIDVAEKAKALLED